MHTLLQYVKPKLPRMGVIFAIKVSGTITGRDIKMTADARAKLRTARKGKRPMIDRGAGEEVA